MTPPKPGSIPTTLRVHFDAHAKDQMRIRKYGRDVVREIMERCHESSVEQDEVLRENEDPFGDHRRVLQVEQDGNLHRIIFWYEAICDCLGELLDPVEATVHTVIFKNGADSLPGCTVVELDGTYDLPDRDWEKNP